MLLHVPLAPGAGLYRGLTITKDRITLCRQCLIQSQPHHRCSGNNVCAVYDQESSCIRDLMTVLQVVCWDYSYRGWSLEKWAIPGPSLVGCGTGEAVPLSVVRVGILVCQKLRSYAWILLPLFLFWSSAQAFANNEFNKDVVWLSLRPRKLSVGSCSSLVRASELSCIQMFLVRGSCECNCQWVLVCS